MKYILSLRNCICFAILFSPTFSFANVVDCPAEKKALCAKIKQLEELYHQLTETSGIQKKDLSGPAYALSLGYANIGNKDKAEEYLNRSDKADSSQRKYNRNAIFEQYMLRGQNDEVISYLNTEGASLRLCRSAVQIYTAQNRVDLIVKLLNDTACTPKHLSKGAEHLDRDNIISLHEKLSLLYDDFDIIERPSLLSTVFAGYGSRRRILKQEINKLLILIVQKSDKNDLPHPIFDLIEKTAINDPQGSKGLLKALIAFYAAQNDLKAMTLFTENKNTFSKANDILPAYDLKKNPTELSFLIYNDIEDVNIRFNLLESLLNFVSKNSALAENNQFKHISELCLNMNFSQCIAAHIPAEKITEEVKLKIDAYLSNYAQLHAYETNHKALIERLEKPKPLSVTKKPDGTYKVKDKDIQDPLWGIHVLIAHKDDCSRYYREDLEKIQNNIQDLSKYTGENPYFAVQCLFTMGQYKELVYSSGNEEYAWLIPSLSSAFSNRSTKSYERILSDTTFLTKDIDQTIKKAIIYKLLQVVDDEAINEKQREDTYNAIDAYLMTKTNYDPELLNITFTEYFLDRQNRRAFNLVYSIPAFQKYIEDNFKSDKISRVIRTGYKIPLSENKRQNEANTLSWEVINTVRKDSEHNGLR
ncbi:MAG: hypothetical protein ACTHOO_08200 [Alcanivorax sp.]